MRINDSIIYLSEPVFGRKILKGPVAVMTTWLDYTFSEEVTPLEMGLDENQEPPGQVRVLIPLNNVVAVVVEQLESGEKTKVYGKLEVLESL